MTDRPNSQKSFTEANDLFPGGVNSPVRAYRSVGGNPVFLARGRGAEVTDVDGNAESRKGTVSIFNGPPLSIQTWNTATVERDRVAQWLRAQHVPCHQRYDLAIHSRPD